MTRRPFDPREIDGSPSDLADVTGELERYADLTATETPHDLATSVMASLADAPPPRRGPLALLLAPFWGLGQSSIGRTALFAGTMALAVAVLVVVGELAGLLRNDQVGPSPLPSNLPSASEEVSPTASPTLSPSASPTAVPTPEPTLAPSPTPLPSVEPSDDETPGVETPRPTETADDHGSETPEPSDDNSGSGGSGDG